MKTFLFLIAAFLFINMAMAAIKQKRAVTAEPIVFEVEVRAPCEAYLPKVLSSIQISSFSSPGCLPINLTNPTTDINDRNSHVFCRNIDFDTRSIFYFHEIFPGTIEDETPAPGEIFIVSWISPVHFIERGRQYTYLRRPDCNVEDDLCTNLTIVGYCKDKPVSFLNGYVATTDDRIYFIPPNAQVGTCTLNDNCCPYVNTLPTGICGGVGDACSFLDCNDGLVCTDDSCSQGRCMHDPVCKSNSTCLIATCNTTDASCGTTPKCSTNDVCKTVVCNNGACSYPDKCTSSNPCLLPTCNATGDCGLTEKCTTTDPCKNANCYANGTCYLTDTCISTNSCLIATCNATGFCNITEKCTTNDPCKNANCYPNGTCYLTDTCISTNSCLIATCNATGFCNITEKCTTTDPCKNANCYPNGTCYLTDTCTTDDPCMVATCNAINGTCLITPKCNNPDLCTNATCDAGTCTFTPKNCSDSIFCTVNERCNLTDGQCISDVRDCSGPMSTDKCILSALCNTTSDTCQYNNVTCPADNMCFKNSQCNTTNGVCAYQNRTICNDGVNCTRDSCNNNTGCVYVPACTSDNDPCSVDYCLESRGGSCGRNVYCPTAVIDPNSNICQTCHCTNSTLCALVNDSIIYTSVDAYSDESDYRSTFLCYQFPCTKRNDFSISPVEEVDPIQIEHQAWVKEELQKIKLQKEVEEENRKIQKERLEKEKTSQKQPVPQENDQKKKSWWHLWK